MIKLKSYGHNKSEDFEVDLGGPRFYKNLALRNMMIEFSWDNITEKFKNNEFILENTKTNQVNVITIPDGNYTIRDFNVIMIKIFGIDSPLKFGIIEARGTIIITLSKDWELDLTRSHFHKIIGFKNKIYPSRPDLDETEYEGENEADITHGNYLIYIHCDAVTGTLINGIESDVIYSFPTGKFPPKTPISKEFTNLIYFRVKRDPLYKIRMSITNQDNVPIDLKNGYVEFDLIPQ